MSNEIRSYFSAWLARFIEEKQIQREALICEPKLSGRRSLMDIFSRVFRFFPRMERNRKFPRTGRKFFIWARETNVLPFVRVKFYACAFPRHSLYSCFFGCLQRMNKERGQKMKVCCFQCEHTHATSSSPSPSFVSNKNGF